MEPRISLITLGVADLERATRFYEECLRLPRLKTPPSVTFFELGKTWLALWSRDSLAADAGPPSGGSGFPGFSLAHNVPSPAGVGCSGGLPIIRIPPMCNIMPTKALQPVAALSRRHV